MIGSFIVVGILMVVYLVYAKLNSSVGRFIRNLYLFCISCKTNVKYEIYDVLW